MKNPYQHYAKARTPRGTMNKLESRYYKEVLEPGLDSGQCIAVWYERLKFILADLTTYLPDFLVIEFDGTMALHECKGWWTSPGRIKIKQAAAQFPVYRWIGVQWKGKQWVYEEFETSIMMPRINYV